MTYDADQDFAKSINLAYAVIRTRVANGGRGWEPSKQHEGERVKAAKMRHVRIDLGEANAFVAEHHRHHKTVVGHVFSLGCALNEKIVGNAAGAVGPSQADHGSTSIRLNRNCCSNERHRKQ